MAERQQPILAGKFKLLNSGQVDGSFKPTDPKFRDRLEKVRKELGVKYVFAPSLAFTKRTGSVTNPMEAGYMVGPEGKAGVQEEGIVRTIAKADGGIIFLDELKDFGLEAKDIALAGFNADCPFIVGYEEEKKALFMLHAGLGCLHKFGDTGKNTIFQQMLEQYHLNPKKIKIHVTAGIQKCCYGRNDEYFPRVFDEWGLDLKDVATEERKGQTSLDLSKMIEKDLARMGVPDENIVCDKTCTCHSGDYWSNVKGNPERNLVLVQPDF